MTFRESRPIGSSSIVHARNTKTYVTVTFDLCPWYSTGF